MAKDRNARYPSATALSEALNALTTGQPIKALTDMPARSTAPFPILSKGELAVHPSARAAQAELAGVRGIAVNRQNVTASQETAPPSPSSNSMEGERRVSKAAKTNLFTRLSRSVPSPDVTAGGGWCRFWRAITFSRLTARGVRAGRWSAKLRWGGATVVGLLAILLGWVFFGSMGNLSAKDGMEMVFVPAGEFLMGSMENDSVAYNDEIPQRTVYLDEFWIDKTEVSNAMFGRFVEETGYQTDAEKEGAGFTYNRAEENWISTEGANWQHPFGPDSNLEGLEDHPVVQMTWYDAQAYCEWAGRRLPTEAEWEKAARGTDGRKHPWGNESVEKHLVNFSDYNFPAKWSHESMDDGYYLTAPVDSYPEGASPFGALNMVGNAWEWVADWYDENYYKEEPPDRNPSGPEEGYARSLRGGSYSNGMRWIRTTYRGGRDPSTADMGFGFRCAKSP